MFRNVMGSFHYNSFKREYCKKIFEEDCYRKLNKTVKATTCVSPQSTQNNSYKR